MLYRLSILNVWLIGKETQQTMEDISKILFKLYTQMLIVTNNGHK